ncbi:MAG: helix-turn-helix domain-containing protein [Caldilineales bacterium]
MTTVAVTDDFGQWLKRRRKALGLTQKALARHAGCAEVTLRKIEAGDLQPSTALVASLAAALGVLEADLSGLMALARGTGDGLTACARLLRSQRPNNLLAQLTPLIGREQDVIAVRRRLIAEGARMVSLIGPPGVGKTRLALAVAEDVLEQFDDGVFFVRLAPVSDPDQVAGAIAQAVGMQMSGPNPPELQLRAWLEEKHQLLVLDNFEQIVAAAPLVDDLLRRCPWLHVLVTSRQPLRLRGERQVMVQPLALPTIATAGSVATAEDMLRYPAVELFADRAEAVLPDFVVDDGNALAVAELCRRLDGLPLAIELVAARVKLLPPAELLKRLHGPWLLSTDGLRDVSARQKTLRGAIGWSYDLLSPAEQTLFTYLSVFVGGFALEAAELLCGDTLSPALPHTLTPAQVLDGIASLLDKNLLHREIGLNRGIRYGLLETVRQYGQERLQSSGEWEALQDRHLACFLALAQEGEPHVFAGNPAWIDRFEADFNNFRAAMTVALARSPESAILLAKALDEFTQFSPRRYESYGWAMRILDDTSTWPPGLLRASALFLAGDLSWSTGDNERAVELMEAALDMAHQLGDTRPLQQLSCLAIYRLAVVQGTRGDIEQMKRYADQLMPVARQVNDPCFIAWAFWLLGHWEVRSGRFELARVDLEQSLAIARREGLPQNVAASLYTLTGLEHSEGNLTKAKHHANEWLQVVRSMSIQWGILTALTFLGRILVQEGDTLHARMCLEEGLVIARDLRLRGEQVACLAGLAAVAGMTGEEDHAARLYGAIESDYALPHHWTMSDLAQRVYDPIFAEVRKRLGTAAFDAAAASGRQLSLNQAIELALHPGSTGVGGKAPDPVVVPSDSIHGEFGHDATRTDANIGTRRNK